MDKVGNWTQNYRAIANPKLKSKPLCFNLCLNLLSPFLGFFHNAFKIYESPEENGEKNKKGKHTDYRLTAEC